MEHGPIAFPLLGVFAAISFVLCNRLFPKQWIQLALMAMYALIIVCVLGSLLAPRFTTRQFISANQTLEATRDGGFSSAFAVLAFWSRVPQFCR